MKNYKCPKCGNTDKGMFVSGSSVSVTMVLDADDDWVMAPISQGDIEAMQVEAIENWDSNDEMRCTECGHEAPEFEFRADRTERIDAMGRV